MFKKIDKIEQVYEQYRNVILYFLIGSSAASIDLSIYIVLFNFFDISAILSTIISVFSATIWGFTLNIVYNFKVNDRLVYRFLSYSFVSAVGILLSISMLYYFYNILGFNGNIVKIISMPIIFITQYTLNKMVSFRKMSN